MLRIRLRAEIDRLAPDVVVTQRHQGARAGRARVQPGGRAARLVRARRASRTPDLAVRAAALGRRPAGVVAISRYVAGQFRPLVAGPAPVHVVRNIVDPGRLRPGMPLPADLRKPADAIWLGVVGALTPLKGQDVFLDAAARVAARVPTARFLVVGGEPYRTEQGLGWAAKPRGARARAPARGARRLPRRARRRTRRDREPRRARAAEPRAGRCSAVTILEAMACAVPVIAVDRWGPRRS
mgnify:CR=1 FL=1